MAYSIEVRAHDSVLGSEGAGMASVAIEQVVEGETTTHTITWDWTHPVATRNVAIAGAKQQAIDWIDSQSPPPVITCKWWQIEPTANLADTTTAGSASMKRCNRLNSVDRK